MNPGFTYPVDDQKYDFESIQNQMNFMQLIKEFQQILKTSPIDSDKLMRSATCAIEMISSSRTKQSNEAFQKDAQLLSQLDSQSLKILLEKESEIYRQKMEKIKLNNFLQKQKIRQIKEALLNNDQNQIQSPILDQQIQTEQQYQ